MVFLVEPFSHFTWVYPLDIIDASHVQQACLLAFSRPGISTETYSFCREKIHRFVVDGGSEFKGIFPTILPILFPFAKLDTALAKHRTNGHPTKTGSLENNVKGFKKRLYRLMDIRQMNTHDLDGLNVLQNQQEGLQKALEEYNDEPRDSLNNHSPATTVRELMDPVVRDVTIDRIMNIYHLKKKKNIFEFAKTLVAEETMNAEGYFDPLNNYYRIFYSPRLLAKETDITMSTDMYRVLDVVAPDQARVQNLRTLQLA